MQEKKSLLGTLKFQKGLTHPEHIEFLIPETLPRPAGYSHVAKVAGGQTLYLSGQIALNAEGQLIGVDGFRAQAIQVFENIKKALEAAGADFSHVVKLTMFLVDLSYLPVLREVRDQYINLETPPVSSLVEVSRLIRQELLLEIEAIASLPA
ncbi:reactive intermediate/imine deaminase [Thermosporothrix hazakensis]|jgi:reactive intermediate/imine deaminase|uniref:Reactive intermediate/imine deaminase n=1 Tax=Thermosporothrix hazakensis TaxID=644383 RepID=A0A326UDA3_THEHA|nr:RidA family protein [Thermosporothrix hazakensis]PZW32704.1 reactive intermediate/imine deaminase [Thermosporothrix hazakensis]